MLDCPRKIKLYGDLAEFVGVKEIKTEAHTVANAVRCLIGNYPQSENYMMDKSWGLNRIRGIKHLAFAKPPVESKYLASCSHPSWEGHKLISEKLIPYIETKL